MSASTTIKETCPAFKTGCPYAHASESFTTELSKCPAFKDGACPFKGLANNSNASSFPPISPEMQNYIHSFLAKGAHPDAKSAQEALANAQNTCPHFKEGCPFKDVSGQLLEEIKSCPAFREGCPFASLTSRGESLLSALKKYKWSGGFIFEDSEIDEEEDPNFAQKIKDGTHVVHDLAENCEFITKFREGTLEKEVYLKFLIDIEHIYTELEHQIVQNKSHPSISKIYFQSLERKDAIAEDIDFFCHFAGVKRQDLVPTLAAKLYVDRIKEIGKSQPQLLIAHHYTRYLGDLSGGKILKRMLKKCFPCMKDDDRGTTFYDFPQIPSANTFKSEYRDRINSLRLPTVEVDEIVREAVRAFVFNINLFREMDGQEPICFEKFEAANKPKAQDEHPKASKEEECPFFKKSGNGANANEISRSVSVSDAPKAECFFAKNQGMLGALAVALFALLIISILRHLA